LPCPYYATTARGRRCALLPPEEWRNRERGRLGLCADGYRSCEVYARLSMLEARWRRGGEGAQP
jgi:predicted DNA-binding ArsR family transcriptional regulator